MPKAVQTLAAMGPVNHKRCLKVLLLLCLLLVLAQFLASKAVLGHTQHLLEVLHIAPFSSSSSSSAAAAAAGQQDPTANDTTTSIRDTTAPSSLPPSSLPPSSLPPSSLPFAPLNSSLQLQQTGQNASLPPCPAVPPALVGPLAPYLHPLPWDQLNSLFPGVQHGGRYSPPHCRPRRRVAVLVPYRNRDAHLRLLLQTLHPILQRQLLQYRILVSEPEMPTTFNRGLALNVGFLEAAKLDTEADCFILHDVDLMPEDDRIPYSCSSTGPQHLSVAVNTFNYRLPYNDMFGGVTALTKEQFLKINGFPNVYYGWGGEDDDARIRVKAAGVNITRPPIAIARYRMARHTGDKTNPRNPRRYALLKRASARMSWDGLGSLGARRATVEEHALYTRVLFHVDKEAILKELESREGKFL